MAGVNKVILIGNLGKDPEVRYLEGGTAVAKFTLATSENYKDRTTNEDKSIVEWHKIVVWKNLAEFVEKYLKKGNQIYVEGKLRSRKWQGKDGIDRHTTEIVADTIQLIGRKDDNTGNTAVQPSLPASPEIE